VFLGTRERNSRNLAGVCPLRAHVEVIHPFVPGLQSVFLVDALGNGAGFDHAVQVEIPAANPGVVTEFAQIFRKAFHVGRQRSVETPYANRDRRLAGHERRTRGNALREEVNILSKRRPSAARRSRVGVDIHLAP
jgi:hypothetical protein